MRVYRWLLRLLPAAFREELGGAMEAAAAAGAADRPGAARALYWVRECASLTRVAVQERMRERRAAARTRGGTGMGAMEWVRELRFAVRRLVRAPGFTAAALLTLTLALGAALSIWAVVKNVVLDPLPWPESDALVQLEHGLPGIGAARGVNMTEALHVLYRDEARVFDGVALYANLPLTLTGAGEPESLMAVRATPGLARVLRTEPVLGRWFDAAAGRAGGAREVVLAHGLWVSRFGSDAGLVGRTILLNDMPYEVIGVMPRGFAFPDADARLWLPVAEPGADARVGGFNFNGIARLAAGATVEDARVAMDALIARLPESFPDAAFAHRLLDDAKLNAQPLALKERVVGSVVRTLWVLLATVGLVLVLACANVANLFLVRADARRTEVAVRRALGGGWRALVVPSFTESLLLSATGGAAAVGVAAAVVRLLRSVGPEQLPRLEEIGLDASVMAMAPALALLVTVALGVLPLLRRQPGLAQAVHEASRRASAGAARVRARSLLVATQVALAAVLLVACGLMARSFQQLARVDHGFDADGVLTFHVSLPGARYPDADAAVLFHTRLLERLNGLPGVEAAAVASCAPLEGWCYGDPLVVEGRVTEGTPPVVALRRATPGWFTALSMRLHAGRLFTEADAAAPVAVINRALAELYFPGEDPVGRQVRAGPAEFAGPPVTIVGVIDNTATMAVTETRPAPLIFFPMALRDTETGIPQHSVTYAVRGAGAPLALVPAVREAVRELDAALAVADVTTLEQAVRDSGARIAFALILLGIAAATALALGAVGIYGVLSYAVTRRTGEIGVRLALGAHPRQVVRMVVRQGGAAAGAGLVLGLVAALAFARFMESTLFGVSATDPLTFGAAAVVLGALALFASWLPARRAAALDPVAALRAD